MNLSSPALILMTLNCAAIAGVAAIEGVAAVAAARVRVAKHMRKANMLVYKSRDRPRSRDQEV